MYVIGHSEPSLVPGNEHYHFCSRAKVLLARWKPILLQDIHHYWWVKSDPWTLSYIPKQAGASLRCDFIPFFDSCKYRVS